MTESRERIIRYEGQKALEGVQRFHKVVAELRSETQSSTLERQAIDAGAAAWNYFLKLELEDDT